MTAAVDQPEVMREPTPRTLDHAGNVALLVVAATWLAVLARIVSHRIYISHDSMINYAHVWFVSDRIWHAHSLPLRMPVVSHGDGFAFPYGVVPWLAASLMRPVLGDWSTTLVLVLATIGVMLATFWAFPELRRGWWAVAVLVEPAIVTSPIIAQIPFLTATALLLVAVGAWRRDRPLLAVVFAGLAQATHPAIVLPLTFGLVAAWLRWEPRRGALVRAYAVSLVIAAPAVALVLASPVFEESSTMTKAVAFVETIAPRCLVIVVPIALVLLLRRTKGSAAAGAAASVAMVAMTAGVWVPIGMGWAWGALGRQPDTHMVTFTESSAFVPGATYRVLRLGDGKIGLYQLLQHGARLDSEFFPESMDRRSWPSTTEYLRFLDSRHVEFVMLWSTFDDAFHTNEHRLLDDLAGQPNTDRRVRLVGQTHDYDLYAVDPARPRAALTTAGG